MPFKTRCPFLVQGFQGGAVAPYPDFYLPKGLQCAFRSTRSKHPYILDELPEDIFPLGSSIRRDAQEYGILIPVDYIEGGFAVMDTGASEDPEESVTGLSLVEAMRDHISRMHVHCTKIAKTGELVMLGFQNGAYIIQIGPTVTCKNNPGDAAALWNSL